MFSRGHILLPHVRNRLKAQTVQALLCLGEWSRLNLINSDDVREMSELPELANDSDTDYEMPAGWARIKARKRKSAGRKRGHKKAAGKESKQKASVASAAPL